MKREKQAPDRRHGWCFVRERFNSTTCANRCHGCNMPCTVDDLGPALMSSPLLRPSCFKHGSCTMRPSWALYVRGGHDVQALNQLSPSMKGTMSLGQVTRLLLRIADRMSTNCWEPDVQASTLMLQLTQLHTGLPGNHLNSCFCHSRSQSMQLCTSLWPALRRQTSLECTA